MDESLLYLDLTLLTNSSSRTEWLGGREYLVCEATILVEGVLNGSDGPLYYSKEEISQNPGIWNEMPLVAPHPMATDPSDGKTKPVSARSPGIREKYTVGLVYNDRMENGERKVDVWFDVQNSNRIDKRIIPKVRSGEPINVSTGIFSKKNQAVQNAHHNGKGYTHSVHAIRPDHLAVLLDDKGACSTSDGCGINLPPKPTTNFLLLSEPELDLSPILNLSGVFDEQGSTDPVVDSQLCLLEG